MTFNLDFALFYAYTLALFGFLGLYLARQAVRAVALAFKARNHRPRGPRSPLSRRLSRGPETRFEAFTRAGG